MPVNIYLLISCHKPSRSKRKRTAQNMENTETVTTGMDIHYALW